uniref:Uncharacterized protein n=1 Tax=Caenorhabditis tropicalis TaxID=1561998 RepID=A0A1I7UH79_9PELO
MCEGWSIHGRGSSCADGSRFAHRSCAYGPFFVHRVLPVMTAWRNGSAFDSRSKGWAFDPLSGQMFFVLLYWETSRLKSGSSSQNTNPFIFIHLPIFSYSSGPFYPPIWSLEPLLSFSKFEAIGKHLEEEEEEGHSSN